MKINITIKLNDVLDDVTKATFTEMAQTSQELIDFMIDADVSNESPRFLHKEIMVLKNLQYSLEDAITLFDESDNTRVRNSSNTN